MGYEKKKNLDLALNEAKIGMENYKRIYPNLLAQNGRIAEAEELARELKKNIEAKNPTLMYNYWFTLGLIEQTKGNAKTAVTYYEKAEKEAPPLIQVRLFLAQAYLELGRLSEAVAVLEQILSRYNENKAFAVIYAVKAHYLLGWAYEKSGWTNKAIKQYEEFLDIYKNADPGIPEVADAKERLKKLKKIS